MIDFKYKWRKGDGRVGKVFEGLSYKGYLDRDKSENHHMCLSIQGLSAVIGTVHITDFRACRHGSPPPWAF